MKKNYILIATVIFALIAGFSVGYFVAKPTPENKLTYAMLNGQPIKATEVLDKIKPDLDQLEKNKYNIIKRSVEELIQQKLAVNSKEDPPLAGRPKEQTIAPAELEAFLKERNLNQKKISKTELDNILNNMKFRKAQQGQKEVAAQAIAKADIKWKIPLPESQIYRVSEGQASRLGPWLAPVKIIMLGSFHCPFCTTGGKRLSEIKEKYKDNVRFNFHFSVHEQDNSIVRVTAEAALCADDQAKFWPFFDLMMADMPVTDAPALMAAAQTLGLNSETFEKCLKERKHKSAVENESKQLRDSGLVAVPVFLVNGKSIAAQSSLEEISILIDSEIE